jgi:hypothetical protein
MKPLPHEIELHKVLDAIRETAPHLKVPPIYMFEFLERYELYGNFHCDNLLFVETIVHEVIHVNYWELGHSDVFYDINNRLFKRVWNRLQKGGLNESNTSIKA